MATQNATISTTWTLIADTADDPLLIQPTGAVEFEVATMDTATIPTIGNGHPLITRQMQATRSLLGDGYVYARALSVDGGVLAVTGSSESLS